VENTGDVAKGETHYFWVKKSETQEIESLTDVDMKIR
jgi:hypothetical protein